MPVDIPPMNTVELWNQTTRRVEVVVVEAITDWTPYLPPFPEARGLYRVYIRQGMLPMMAARCVLEIFLQKPTGPLCDGQATPREPSSSR